MNNLQSFFTAVQESANQGTLVKLTMSKPRGRLDYKTVFVKLVKIKDDVQLSFVYRHPTNDVTKNYGLDKGISLIRRMTSKDFVHADLFTKDGAWHLTIDKLGDAIVKHKSTKPKVKPNLAHDKKKTRLIELQDNVYLRELGILTDDWQIKKNSEDKYRQINKFVEVVGGVIQKQNLPAGCTIIDMGCGKGYLTFALYDYLVNGLDLEPNILGVELRQHLVDTCNGIAELAGFKDLHFHAGTIEDADLPNIDVLIALHACDTATDDAIYRGLQSQSSIIICAPCCHKQVRKQIAPDGDLKEITRFGILEERQAEILTDGIRALILEAYGYRTKVFEFISTEHTPKNVMIVAIKDRFRAEPNPKKLAQIEGIKTAYGIKQHYLESLLNI